MKKVKLLVLILLQPTFVWSQPFTVDTGQSHCYDLEQQIPCNSSDFPRQDGDYDTTLKKEGRWILSSSGITEDKLTKLFWTQCSLGANNTTCDKPKTMSWKSAVHSCKKLDFKDHSWRLPTILELNTLVDIEQSSVKINSSFFSDTQPAPYWTNNHSVTQKSKTKRRAWFIHFADASIFDANISELHFARCVSSE